MTETKSGEDLEPVRGVKGGDWTRRFFHHFGIGVPRRNGSESNSE